MSASKPKAARRTSLAVVAAAALVAALLFSSAPSVHGQGDGEDDLAVQFPAGTSISDKAYTAGTRANLLYTYLTEPRLPEVTVSWPADTFEADLTYSATGLPAGLTVGYDRVIRGTPEAATSGPVTVTYTADVTTYVWDETTQALVVGDTASASLTFNVTVNAAVTFDEAATTFLTTKLFIHDTGQGWRDAGDDGTITFPAASGGTGTITYQLIDNDSEKPLADVAGGITFDTTTRKLGGTPTQAARKDWAVRYIAKDENGSRAVFSSTVYGGGYGGL